LSGATLMRTTELTLCRACCTQGTCANLHSHLSDRPPQAAMRVAKFHRALLSKFANAPRREDALQLCCEVSLALAPPSILQARGSPVVAGQLQALPHQIGYALLTFPRFVHRFGLCLT
jgi:hypothetical protein